MKDNSVFHKKSDAGKGDVPRQGISRKEWGDKWEKIFRKKKRIIYVYSSDDCRVDENGGPYKIEIDD